MLRLFMTLTSLKLSGVPPATLRNISVKYYSFSKSALIPRKLFFSGPEDHRVDSMLKRKIKHISLYAISQAFEGHGLFQLRHHIVF